MNGLTNEDFRNHPFFRNEQFAENESMPALIEAFQQLKYSPEENSPEELIETYRADGLHYFKLKQFTKALDSYTLALNVPNSDRKLKAILLNNRAAAHFRLENYRSSINDNLEALKLNPDYEKCKLRLANCYLKLTKYEKCLELCDIVARTETGTHDASNWQRLRDECSKLKEARDLLAAKKPQIDRILRFLKNKRTVNIEDDDLEPIIEPLIGHTVHFADRHENTLCWPLVVYYADSNVADFIEEFHERQTLKDHLEYMFKENGGYYSLENVDVFFERNGIEGQLERVDVNRTLLEILENPKFLIRNGTPEIIIKQCSRP